MYERVLFKRNFRTRPVGYAIRRRKRVKGSVIPQRKRPNVEDRTENKACMGTVLGIDIV